MLKRLDEIIAPNETVPRLYHWHLAHVQNEADYKANEFAQHGAALYITPSCGLSSDRLGAFDT